MRTLAFLDIQHWEFRGPILIGDTIRLRSKVVQKEPRARGRRGIVSWQRQIVNQDGRIVQEGITRTLVEGRAAIRADEEESAAERSENTGLSS